MSPSFDGVLWERGSSEGSESVKKSVSRTGLDLSHKFVWNLPSPRRRSARPFRRPAASARSFSRFSSRSRFSLSRRFLAAAPRIFLRLCPTTFSALSSSSSESPIGESVFLSESEVEESEPVRCLLLSSLGLVEGKDHISDNL